MADGVRRTFGGLTAVDVDHVEVQRGAITALIGPNGAGKTTFFNLLTGFDKPDSGQVDLRRARRWPGCRPTRWPGAGMVRTFQLTKSLARLSVLENMKLGGHQPAGRATSSAACSSRSGAARRARSRPGPTSCSARFKLDHMRDEFAGSLSGGQRKLLEMARALMVRARAW